MSEEKLYDIPNEERASRILSKISGILDDRDIKEISGFLFFLTLTEQNDLKRSYATHGGFLDPENIVEFLLELGVLEQLVTT